MPRSRRRHHSRSRSRSRSHSHDRDREPKRRKIEGVDSPAHKRSVSCEPHSPTEISVVPPQSDSNDRNELDEKEVPNMSVDDLTSPSENKADTTLPNDEKPPANNLGEKLKITPQKAMSPRQLQKKLESEKKRQQKQTEREEREKKKQEEKERIRLEKLKQKQEKDEQKTKEKELKEEQKRKEKEERDQKRKEKEEREEQKRKEREQEKLRKQQELDEKNKEKQKQEEQKQKAAAAFVNFFLPKKQEVAEEKKPDEDRTVKTLNFMPFQVKSDMRLPPSRRPTLTETERQNLVKYFENPDGNCSYLRDLREGKFVGKSPKTWKYEDDSDDVVLVEDDFGESICEDKPKTQKMRAKFFKFHENRRPAYFGTWRKTSGKVNPRKPFVEDTDFFDYEVDSDDDWEEEEQGESLNGSDDEDKENEVDNDDYEVDNDFFVPHGHLSDDEIDDESTAKLSPESLKQKLKLLKDEFDHDMQTKTHKIKPRSIGCIWYNKDGSNVEEAIDRHLKPLAMITNGRILMQKRTNDVIQTPTRKHAVKELKRELIPAFLKLIHGNVKKKAVIVTEFLNYMENNACDADMLSKQNLGRILKQFAQWKKCPDKGPMFHKFCWYVEKDVREKYNVKLGPLK